MRSLLKLLSEPLKKGGDVKTQMFEAMKSFPFKWRLEDVLENNQKWANFIHLSEPEFFPRHAHSQTPKIFWIGEWKKGLWLVLFDHLI